MTAVQPEQAGRVGIVGAGVIGGGWALHYLRTGFDVDVYDPSPSARTDLIRMLEANWPLLDQMGLRDGASQDRLAFHDSLAAAVAQADLIQENAPENGPVKRQVLADVDRAARPGVVIASSTSGFAMTMLQADCEHPERCVVGHPFNPPYLIPVVEVVGGQRTDPAAVDWLVRFYASTGKRPLRLTQELPGFVGNRLQEAMWREALHMVAAGEATVEEIDASIAFGPGLRWALMGPCLTFHLAGGSRGMAHMLDHFGAALEEPWTRLQAPALTPELRDRLIEGCLRQADGRSVADLERLRDGFLAELLGLVERYALGPQSAASDQSRAEQTAELAQAVRREEAARRAEPTRQAAAGGPAEPVRHEEAARRAEPTRRAAAGGPAEPARSAESVRPVIAAEPAEPAIR